MGGIGSLTGWDFYEGNKSKLLRQGTLVLSLEYLPEILFTRIYLGEKCKCAVFLKKKKEIKKKSNGTIKMESRK